ncbi:MAG: hypothetical protein BYD32DRAFT_413746 [Podila humilis]|nr:MAG: hypothetical protein BYD32DRAFT_413746 [Podila humilis]
MSTHPTRRPVKRIEHSAAPTINQCGGPPSVLDVHVQWAERKGWNIPVADFVAEFLYIDRRSCHGAYSRLIQSEASGENLFRLRIEFEEWRKNRAELFWLAIKNIDNVSKAAMEKAPEWTNLVMNQALRGSEKGRYHSPVPGSQDGWTPQNSPRSSTCESLGGETGSPSSKRTPDAKTSYPSAKQTPAAKTSHSTAKRARSISLDGRFVFSGRVGTKDIGPAFAEYRTLTQDKKYSHRAVADQLAKRGILFLGEAPTTHQETAFPDYADIRKAVLKDVGKVDKAIRTKLVDDFRACKDTYLDAYYDSESRVDATKAMVAESRAKEPSFVTQMLENNSQTLEWEDETPESEADLVGSFITPQLGSVFTVPTQSRLIPSATCPSDASVFLYKLQEQEQERDEDQDETHSPKHPDLRIKARGIVHEHGFAEASAPGVVLKDKDGWDLVRICIWGKKASDSATV